MPGFVLDEALVSLGPSCWCALTLIDTVGPWFPMESGAYAFVQTPDGGRVDLLDAIRLRLPVGSVQAELQRLAKDMARAPAALQQRYDYAQARLGGAWWTLPVSVLALDAHYLLLSFAGLGVPPTLRVVDTRSGKVCLDAEAASLFPGTRPERQLFPGLPVIEQAQLLDACAGRALVEFRGRRALLVWEQQVLTARWTINSDGSPVALMPQHLVHAARDDQGTALVVRELDTLRELAWYRPEHPGELRALSAAHAAACFAFNLDDGSLEVADLQARSSEVFAAPGSVDSHSAGTIHLAPQGRHGLHIGAEMLRLIDIAGRRQTRLTPLPLEAVNEAQFVPVAAYRGTQALSDSEYAWLHRGVLQQTALAEMAMQPYAD